MSVEQSVIEYKLSPSKATPKATPPCMEDGISDHDETAPHEQLPSFPRLRDDIHMSDSHLIATITYFCRMVYPHDGDRLHTPSLILDELLSVFSDICADEVEILPFQRANLKMLEIYFKEGLEAIKGKKVELKMDLKGPIHGYNRSDDEADDSPQHHGEIKRDVSNGPAEEDDCCCRYPAYNEDPGDYDGSYCQCASDSEDDLYCQCSSNQTSSDEEGSS
ncbi:hypothetical protein EYC80_004067 [Monilinia laxa]|uniref:Uncharacterized protein n=1 Tax=Monilinia laxa TaxID=61186 RepID=A0A5N6KLS7_MONLA|nr:hypothetical protein EYC80_004067 [Monilinia laxa]